MVQNIPSCLISRNPQLIRKVQFIHFKAGIYAEKALPAAPLNAVFGLKY